MLSKYLKYKQKYLNLKKGGAALTEVPNDLLPRVQSQDDLMEVEPRQDVKSQEEALALATKAAEDMARKRAEAAGAASVEITTSSQIKEVDLGDGKTLFMEGLIQTQAIGLPTI